MRSTIQLPVGKCDSRGGGGEFCFRFFNNKSILLTAVLYIYDGHN